MADSITADGSATCISRPHPCPVVGSVIPTSISDVPLQAQVTTSGVPDQQACVFIPPPLGIGKRRRSAATLASATSSRACDDGALELNPDTLQQGSEGLRNNDVPAELSFSKGVSEVRFTSLTANAVMC